MSHLYTTSPSMHRLWIGLLMVGACLAGGPAVALEANQVRGEIVELRQEENRLRLEVADTGSDRIARAGRIETFEIDSDTEVRMENPRASLLEPDLDALASGTKVLLELEEVDGRRVARMVSVEEEGSGSVAGAGSSAETTEDGSTAAPAGSARGDESGSSRSADMAAMESSRDDQRADGARDTLPATASALPLLAIVGIGFAGLAMLLRMRRR